jgi:abnormal spindle-like microcephaly-associated protein
MHHSSVYAPSGYGIDDNTTANLDYTTEIKPTLQHAKPRRPMRASRKSAFNPGLDIFEDVAQEEEQQKHAAVQVKRRGGIRERAAALSEVGVQRKSTILARKPQKIHLLAPEVREERVAKPHRKRVSQLLSDRHEPEVNATVQLQEDVLEKKELRKQGPKKDPRRRTIYVSSDDTTIMTIHPGQGSHASRNPRAKSPDTGLELVTLSDEEAGGLVSALKKDKKAPRKSLAAPPKRAPLLQSSRQTPSFSNDVLGQGGGKENVPPGMEVFEGKGGTHIEFNFAKEEPRLPATKPAKVHFSSKVSETSSTRPKADGTKKRVRPQRSFDGSPAKSIKAKADALASAARNTTTKLSIKSVKSRITKNGLLSSSPFHTDRSPPTVLRRQRTERAPTKITLMHEVGKPQQHKEQYPVLAEDLSRPEMYEDNWLTYQEVAITQLLNSMFDSASKNPNEEQSSEELRGQMLELYHEPSMLMLHKRLQASLQYGALSIPKDLLAQTLRLKDDVGMRKKFLNLWVKTYDLTALRAAAETIVGRQITVPSRLSSGSTSSDDGSRLMRAERRAMENFLDTFLIRNEDAVRVKNGVGSIATIARGDHNGVDFGSQGWSWRRTVLRSLMLAHLLDRAKTADVLSGCLFQSTSPYKTSTDVLHALANLLLPSLGDVTRPLGHLNYKVEAVQYPLQEFTYHISNIAIDLRDGVILTRLVELLLYPPTTLTAQQEDTVTITMPTGDVLTSAFDFSAKESWVLSQHLKFPSIGRAQKLYNVQIALAALNGVKGVPVKVVGGIKPEDVVDGHREKTLSLLWSLVGKHGLGSLVDWPQIVKEIEHFREAWYKQRDNYAQHDLDSDEDESTTELDGLEYHKRLLLSWARCVARTHGLRVANLTTSFSNPKVLEAIVDTYLPTTVFTSTGASSHLSLAAKLKATGCSTSFIALFANHSTTPRSIPSKDFTLLTLSFLASRLLPLRITHRAASIIQRAFRNHLFRRSVHNHIVKMKVAHECAAVAQAREQLTNAATLIQRRWKAVLEGRRARLEAQVLLFQSLARGWAIRRWVRRVTGGRVGGKEKVRRVRGGW